MNTQVLCNKRSETVKMNYCAHCDFKSKRKYNVKMHMQRTHAPILNQENVDQDITGVMVCVSFAEDRKHDLDSVQDDQPRIKRKCEENR